MEQPCLEAVAVEVAVQARQHRAVLLVGALVLQRTPFREASEEPREFFQEQELLVAPNLLQPSPMLCSLAWEGGQLWPEELQFLGAAAVAVGCPPCSPSSV